MKKIIVVLFSAILFVSACSRSANLETVTNCTNKDEDINRSEEKLIQETKNSLNTVNNLIIDLETVYQKEVMGNSNVYYIDNNNVLWGYGKNEYGQLGVGSSDFDYHNDVVKISDNVIHVDYSEYGYVIYLTSDNCLYGLGNAYSGVFPEVHTFYDQGGIGTGGYIGADTPQLIATDVLYASCGQTDISYINTSNELWTIGVLWYLDYKDYLYNQEAVKILEDVIYVTGNWFNYVAIKKDGTVWTWGYNFYGNCGICDELVVSEPIKIMSDCTMIWTGADNIDVLNFNRAFGLANTIVQKVDGTYWVCGEDAGKDEKIVPYFYPEIKAKWSYEFVEIN